MTRKDFENVFKGLLDAFPSAFNAARVERITAIIAGINFADLRKVNDYLLDKSRYAPLPEDFKNAINELGIKRGEVYQSVPYKKQKIDIAHLEGDWFFDDYKIFTRGKSVKDCRMIIRSENPDHPLVIKCFEMEQECLKGRYHYIPKIESGKPKPDDSIYDKFFGPKYQAADYLYDSIKQYDKT